MAMDQSDCLILCKCIVYNLTIPFTPDNPESTPEQLKLRNQLVNVAIA